MATVSRVGDFSLVWGESVRWDDRRERLYFVDCAGATLHWLEGGEPPLRTMQMPGLPTGLVLAEDGRVIVALDDGLALVDPDAGTREPLTPYPEGMAARANDANADLDGNLVTGTLNLEPGPGTCWRFSAGDGWSLVDDDLADTNGPVVLDLDGERTLVAADPHVGVLWARPWGPEGSRGARREFARTPPGTAPDGACADDDGGVWSCVLGAGEVVRHTGEGPVARVAVGAELPSDVTFGGPGLDRMYVTTIAIAFARFTVASPLAGALLVADGTGFVGRPEPRFRL